MQGETTGGAASRKTVKGDLDIVIYSLWPDFAKSLLLFSPRFAHTYTDLLSPVCDHVCAVCSSPRTTRMCVCVCDYGRVVAARKMERNTRRNKPRETGNMMVT